MNQETQIETIHHLQIIERYIQTVQRMVMNDDYGIKVICQISATQGMLSKVSQELVGKHFSQCMNLALFGNDAIEREKALPEIAKLFGYTNN